MLNIFLYFLCYLELFDLLLKILRVVSTVPQMLEDEEGFFVLLSLTCFLLFL